LPNYSEPLLNGEIITITPADPGPGIDWSTLLPNNYTYELLGAIFTLVTDITVVTRQVRISFELIGVPHAAVLAPNSQTATQTRTYYATQTGDATFDATTLRRPIALPNRLTLPGNYQILSRTESLQPGDDYSAIILLLRRWVNQTV